jgi:hypothetical protein
MPIDLLEVEGLNIVILGDFNPKILHPIWFSSNNLIREQEVEDAEIAIVHQEVSDFKLEWMRLLTTRDKFRVYTTQVPYYEPLRDLVIGTFKILSHTPIRALGINFDAHLSMGSKEKWHQFGNMLTPKSAWKVLDQPGMLTVTMQGHRKDSFKGHVHVKVEPSTTINNGVYFSINDHYELNSSLENVNSVDELLNVLSSNWKASLSQSKEIIHSLMSQQ